MTTSAHLEKYLLPTCTHLHNVRTLICLRAHTEKEKHFRNCFTFTTL